MIASLESEEAFAGYWQRPDADARALKRGWYFTGDVGYCDADGDLFVTGRVDDMIITGGENVLPVEIESVLSVHPAVAEAAVAGPRGRALGADGRGLRGAQRPSECSRHWTPTAARRCWPISSGHAQYVFVRAIPKSPVGKVLRRKLIAGDYEKDEECGGRRSV